VATELALETASRLDVEEAAAAAAQRTFWGMAVHTLRRDKLTLAALGTLIFIALVAYFTATIGFSVLHWSATQLNPTHSLEGPSFAHLLGTDEFGRDLLLRIAWASSIDLSMGIGVAIVGLSLGVPIGLMAAFFGGWFDDGVNALINTIRSIPGLLLLILIASLFRPNPIMLAVIIGALGWTGIARQIRGVSLQVREQEFIQAARSVGVADSRLMLRHILPNLVSVLTVAATFEMALGIFAEVGLSFLGLGIQVPIPSLGNMLTNSQSYLLRAPWLGIFPGLMITLLILCIYLAGDGLRDAFDPRLPRKR
jgi:peptide/nickel transport system permease protein